MKCVLCKQSDETMETGTLSSKEDVAAHQNCLLFASGLCCNNTPEHDDLFGFSVEDVKEEVKRGQKLICHKCKKRGATAGCEVGRCKKSYHYPCAVSDGAEVFNEGDKGVFGLYCPQHYLKNKENGSSTNGSSSATFPQTSDTACVAGPSKKRPSNSANQVAPPVKLILLSTDSDGNEAEEDSSIFAPLESDIDEESQSLTPAEKTDMGTRTSVIVSKETPAAVNEKEQSIVPTVLPLTSAGSSPGPDPIDAPSVVVPSGTLPPSPVSAPADASDYSPAAPEGSTDSASFWKSCNEAGCTKAFFTTFIHEMNDIADRILSDQASQGDYDLALSVMQAYGKMVNIVTKQNEEMQQKQMELENIAASMKKVLSVLKS